MMLGAILSNIVPYDPERDPVVLREREMIAALRDHTQSLRVSRSTRALSDREEPSGIRRLVSDAPTNAALVSQENCTLVLGLGRRKFLELLRRSDAPPTVRFGKLRSVRADAMVAFIDRLDEKVHERLDPEHEVDGADAVLVEIGCAPIRRRR